jgi:NAD(P)-dependent dehydrogenase (short-subunit alcohol dehydrogenase family)
VIALTKSAALEYARQGVRINALVAGAFETPMLEDGMNRVSGGKPEGSAEMARRYSEMIAAGRIGRPQEAAEAALGLCSDAAS